MDWEENEVRQEMDVWRESADIGGGYAEPGRTGSDMATIGRTETVVAEESAESVPFAWRCVKKWMKEI